MDSLASVTVPSDFDAEAVKAMLTDQLDKKLVALGTQENPAMSCQDIYGCSKDFVPGYYWIDPNEGSAKDAIRVFCKGPETCIESKADLSVPLRFLRLKYSSARQNVTYDCGSGVDGFIKMKLQAADGTTFQFGDKNIRVVSEPGQCPVVLEVDESGDSASSSLPVLQVESRPDSYKIGPVCFL